MVTGLVAQAAPSEDAKNTFGSTTSHFFYGIDLTYTGSDPVGNAYFGAFLNPVTTFAAKTFLGAPTAPGGFRLGIGTNATTDGTATTFTGNLTIGTTYRVVVGYDPLGGGLNLWVNNGVQGSPDLTIAAAGTTTGITGFAIRQGGSNPNQLGNSYSGLNLDNLVIANTFSEAFAGVPEPSTAVLLGIGLLVGAHRLRRRLS